jgi:hypothetical protein
MRSIEEVKAHMRNRILQQVLDEHGTPDAEAMFHMECAVATYDRDRRDGPVNGVAVLDNYTLTLAELFAQHYESLVIDIYAEILETHSIARRDINDFDPTTA